jgi:ankyrin repeat protein
MSTVIKSWIPTVVCLLAAVEAAGADLADLIQAGEREAALEMIRSGADVNVPQADGATPLHWAVYKIDHELVAALLERGANPDTINSYGSRPLSEAVKVGDARLVEMLLEAGADVEARNEDEQTALMLATRTGSIEVAEQLVRHGADVNAKEAWRGQTPLMWAADAGFSGVTKFLIDHGADVTSRAMVNDWPTQTTSEPRNQYRPTGGLTPLLYAARSGCTGCVEAILDAGADIDRPNPDGVTPLMIAIDNLAFDTARFLLERGANAHVWDWWGRTALYVAVDMNTFVSPFGSGSRQSGGTSALDLVRLLLDAGVNPNTQLNMHRPTRGGNAGRFSDEILMTGATPLLRAAAGQDAEAAHLLLEHGALVDLPNVMGVTPLMAATGTGMEPSERFNPDGDAQERAIATLELLLAAGAEVNTRITDVKGRTARVGRSTTLPERGGQTALYAAVQWAWPRVVEYLIEHGAEVDIVDDLGVSPLDAALGRAGSRDNRPSDEVAGILETAINGGAF